MSFEVLKILPLNSHLPLTRGYEDGLRRRYGIRFSSMWPHHILDINFVDILDNEDCVQKLINGLKDT